MSRGGNNPEFSLIVATLGPASLLRQGLLSILTQTYGCFEIIVVDQNERDHVAQIVAEFKETGKVYYTKSQVGLSKARNAGLAMARGRIVGFPDDDCEYPITLLADVKARFLSHEDATGICVRCCDRDGYDSAGRSDRRGGLINKSNVWIRAVSVGMFLKKTQVIEAGGFDESLGLGSGTPFKSGEETDLILKLVLNNRKIFYDPMLNVFHRRALSQLTLDDFKRSYDYGLGKGLVLRRYEYCKYQVLLHCVRPIIGSLVSLMSGNFVLARLRYERARGRVAGWRSSLSLVSKNQ